MEYLELYDENKNKLNKIITRGEKPLDGEHILISLIFIENSEGKFLIQKTSIEKGSKYSSTGGHVLAKEDSHAAIVRELFEELGLKVNKNDLKYLGSSVLGAPIFDVYYLNKDINLTRLTLQKEEVYNVLYMDKEEILKLINEDNIIKSHGILFEKYIVGGKNK